MKTDAHLYGSQNIRLGGLVTDGLFQLITNFSNVAGTLSGPVAIVATGSDIMKTDAAGFFQVGVKVIVPQNAALKLFRDNQFDVAGWVYGADKEVVDSLLAFPCSSRHSFMLGRMHAVVLTGL